MTGVEWMNSFPEKTPEDRREKLAFMNNCSGCHDNGFALQNKFDESGLGQDHYGHVQVE